MKRTLLGLLVSVLAAWSASARTKQEISDQDRREGVQSSGTVSASAKASSQSDSAKLSTGTTIETALSNSLDAHKCKEGDPVMAHTVHAVKSGGKVVLPKGSKVIGHVTQAKARTKGESESALGIVFDKAVLKDGQEIPISLAVQAIAAVQTSAATSLGESDTPGPRSTPGSATSPGGGLAGTAGSVAGAAGTVGNVGTAAGAAVGSTANVTGSLPGAVAGTTASAPLSSSSVGMIGLEGLSLTSSASSSTRGSVITSSTKNVHLDSGTRVLLRVQGTSE